ncbi:hypothetical protein [Endozoicomonas atrinae]|uniref:hypothetical protein n=1 Tax=Endozoicomonas atrinae TaxID=1333660 RepID=UPI000824B95B|nr:hypothetical protein [Endozoicomonas atrinae]
MAGFFSKLFGKKDEPEELLQGMIDRAKKWEVIGTEIAKDCKNNGLNKGEIVRLSEITAFINKNHSYNSKVVESGFLDQMMIYVKSGEVIHFNTDTKDIVFVHKKHANKVLEK